MSTRHPSFAIIVLLAFAAPSTSAEPQQVTMPAVIKAWADRQKRTVLGTIPLDRECYEDQRVASRPEITRGCHRPRFSSPSRGYCSGVSQGIGIRRRENRLQNRR